MPVKLKRAPLRCPNCGFEKLAHLWSGDPENTALVLLPCLECKQEGKDVFPTYLDADGNVIITNVDEVKPNKPNPCLDPDKMHGAADQFPGSDYE